MNHFQDTLQAWRSSKRLTQAQAADLLRVGLSTYQHWESGKIEPRAGMKRFISLVISNIIIPEVTP